MSTQDIQSPALSNSEQTKERYMPVRALLIGGAALLLVLVLIVLGWGSSAPGPAASASGGLLILAPAAFLAGLFSFLSPCTLPILPAYFAFTFQARRERVVVMTISFFFGLATTMVVLGAASTALSQLLFANLRELIVIGGWLIVGFGVLSFLGKGFSGAKLLDRPSTNIAGSYVYGATFALGWTACIGPILGALLTLLATQGIAVVQGAILAFIYALGLGMPLILVATFFSRLGQGSRFWKFMRGRAVSLNLGFTSLHLHSTSMISGAMLIIIGWLLLSGQLEQLNHWALQSPMAQWALDLEQGVQQFFFR